MTKLYVRVKNENPILFDNVAQVVNHLEGLVTRLFKKTRAEWMQHLIELGYGYDDSASKTFTHSMAQFVEIGIIKNGRFTRCDIHDLESFRGSEFGD